MIEFAAAIGFIIAAIFAGLWWRALSRLQAALDGRALLEQSDAGLTAMLDTAPVAALRWRRDGGEESPIGRIPGSGADSSYSGFLAALVPADKRPVPDGPKLKETKSATSGWIYRCTPRCCVRRPAVSALALRFAADATTIFRPFS